MNQNEAEQKARTAKVLELRPYNRSLPACTQELWPKFDKYLQRRGLSFTLARANFWFPSDQAGDGSPRVVIPASATPPNVFWQARAMDDNPKRYQSPAAPKGDALVVVWPNAKGNPPDSPDDGFIQVRKSSVIQGFALFEGPMDALAAAELGYCGVATMGLPTIPGMEHFASMCLGAVNRSRIVVLDSDYKKPMLQAAGMLLELGARVKILDPSPAKDFAELDRVHRLRLMEG